MFLKNNSKNSWLKYDCGICFVDILPEATFEVSDEVGKIILKNLGATNWITKTEAPKVEEKKSVEGGVLTTKKTSKIFKK